MMFGGTDQEKLKDSILGATHEAVDMGDFAQGVMPLLDQLFQTSTSLLYWCNEDHQIVPLAGHMVESVPFYSQNYFSTDILQKNLLRLNPWILHGSSMPQWDEYLDSAAYNECAKIQSIDNFLHLRISDCEMYEPGMLGIMIARTFQQPDFSEHERILMSNLLPTFEVFARRSRRLEDRLKALTVLETHLDHSLRPMVVFDSSAKLYWASARADRLLEISKNGSKRPPDLLQKTVLEMSRFLSRKKKSRVTDPPTSIKLSQKDGANISIDLRILRGRTGEPFIVCELEDLEATPQLLEIGSAYNLTKTELQVLKLIALGLSDLQISKRLFISPSTVHSHVNHILGKFGINSRVQAALIAHGKLRLPS